MRQLTFVLLAALPFLSAPALAATGVVGQLLYSLDVQPGQKSRLSITLSTYWRSGRDCQAQPGRLARDPRQHGLPGRRQRWPAATAAGSNSRPLRFTVPANSTKTLEPEH